MNKCPKCEREFPTMAGFRPHVDNCGRGALAARFWPRVAIGRPTECWLWKGKTYKPQNKQLGYGRVDGSGPYTYAHRVAWILTHGDIPEGLVVRHQCDKILCCNPAHMLIGTDADNSADMVARGRHVFGERARTAKLTDDDVRAIRASYTSESRRDGRIYRSNAKELAAKYGVTVGAITCIVNGSTWKHVRSATT